MPDSVIELRAGAARARLVPHAGGRVSTLRLAGRGAAADEACEVLFPYPEDFFDPLRWAKGGIYPLMPYSGRIAQARLRFGGREIPLPPHPDSAPHTLHGNAQGLAWELVSRGDAHAELRLDSPACAAWPWRYEAHQSMRLEADRLTIEVALRNADATPMPGGIGVHPFFCHDTANALRAQAGSVWPALPATPAEAVRAPRAEESWRDARPLPAGPVNLSFGGWGPEAGAELDLPGGARLRIDGDAVFAHLVLHRPDPPRYVCVEPVSHVSDGFNLAAQGVAGTGTHILAPGETLRGSVRLTRIA